MQNTSIPSLKDHPLQLADPRLKRRRHELIDVLMIAVTALLCGAENFVQMAHFGRAKQAWLSTFPDLPKRHSQSRHLPPGADALGAGQVFRRVPKLDAVLAAGGRRRSGGAGGKTVRRSFDPAKGQSAIHLVSAWAGTNRLVLGQIKVDAKSNEITAVPDLLRALELAGCIVTVDALNCQKQIAKEIKEADAEYALALKGNHETAYAEIKSFLDDAVEPAQTPRPVGVKPAPTLAQCATVEKGHGRIETRRYYQSADLDWFADRAQWAGLQTVGLVEAQREVGGQRTVERRYYLSSLPLDVATFALAVRAHWDVENQVHWVLAVQMNEGQNRARAGHAAENPTALRRLALNLLRRDTRCQGEIKTKQLNAAWDHAYLQSLLGLNA